MFFQVSSMFLGAMTLSHSVVWGGSWSNGSGTLSLDDLGSFSSQIQMSQDVYHSPDIVPSKGFTTRQHRKRPTKSPPPPKKMATQRNLPTAFTHSLQTCWVLPSSLHRRRCKQLSLRLASSEKGLALSRLVSAWPKLWPQVSRPGTPRIN